MVLGSGGGAWLITPAASASPAAPSLASAWFCSPSPGSCAPVSLSRASHLSGLSSWYRHVFFLLCTDSWRYLSLLVLLFILSVPPTFFSSGFPRAFPSSCCPRSPLLGPPSLSVLFPVSAACSGPPVLPVASLALSLATEPSFPGFSRSLAPPSSSAFFLFHLLSLGPLPQFFSFPFLTVFSSLSSSS